MGVCDACGSEDAFDGGRRGRAYSADMAGGLRASGLPRLPARWTMRGLEPPRLIHKNLVSIHAATALRQRVREWRGSDCKAHFRRETAARKLRRPSGRRSHSGVGRLETPDHFGFEDRRTAPDSRRIREARSWSGCAAGAAPG